MAIVGLGIREALFEVLLVDGFGHAVRYLPVQESPTLVLERRTFARTEEFFEGRRLYRLDGAGTPPVRRVLSRPIARV